MIPLTVEKQYSKTTIETSENLRKKGKTYVFRNSRVQWILCFTSRGLRRFSPYVFFSIEKKFLLLKESEKEGRKGGRKEGRKTRQPQWLRRVILA